MPYRLCEYQLLERPVEQPCNCEVRLCGKKNELCKYFYNRKTPYHIVNQIVQSALKDFISFQIGSSFSA